MDEFPALDKEQQEAVLLPAEGRTAMLAGAGSGKSTFLTARAVVLRKYAPNKKGTILALTYTSKAADELQRRLGKILSHERSRRGFAESERAYPGISSRIWAGTIHAFAKKIIEDITIRQVWRSLPGGERDQLNATTEMFDHFVSKDGRVRNILSEEEAQNLWTKTILDDPHLGESFLSGWKRKREDICGLWAGRQASLMSGQLVQATIPHPGTDKAARTRRWNCFDITDLEEYAATLYQGAKMKANKVNYDDLLWMAAAALRFIPHLKDHYSQNLTHILVDEAQDIAYLDYMFLMTLPGFLPTDASHQKLGYTLVGDRRQEIFDFKAGQPGLFKTLLDCGWATRLCFLGTNYRSGPEIVELAARIAQNPYLNMAYEPSPEYFCHAAPNAEPAVVCWSRVPSGHPFSDFLLPVVRQSLLDSYGSRAILVRTNYLKKSVEAVLETVPGALQVFDVSTVHSAKGREWDHVIITGLDKGKFPANPPFWRTAAEALESESRLFYVAVTRARRRLDILESENGVFYNAVFS